MGIVFRQSVKSTLSTLSGALLGAFIVYLTRHLLSDQERGFRDNLTNQAVVAGQILLLGAHNTLAVFIHRYPPEDRRRAALLSLTFLAPLLSIALACALYLLFQPSFVGLYQVADRPFISRYFLWVPAFVLFFAYQCLLETYLITQLKVAKAVFLREVVLRLLQLIPIGLFGFHWLPFDGVVAGTVLAYLIPIALQWAMVRQSGGWRFSLQWRSVFTRDERYELVHFTWFHSLLSVSLTLLGALDALMLGTLSPNGLRSVGIYVVPVLLMSFLQIPYRAMILATSPVLTQAYVANDLSKVRDIFSRSSINILIASLAMWLLIVCNVQHAIALLPPEFSVIKPLVLILSAGRIFDQATGMNDQLLSISKHYKYNFYISLLLVALIVALNAWLIPIYDIYGAAWASTIALIVFNVLKYLIAWQKLGIQPFSVRTPLVVFAAALVYGLNSLVPSMGPLLVDAALRCFLILAAYGALILWLRPSPDIYTYLDSIRSNKRLF